MINLSAPSPLPQYELLLQAYEQIEPYIRETPLIKSERLSELINGEVYIKAESLQKTGAFKFRGAIFRLLNLSSVEKKQGVIAYSSGNFAAGLAAAGQLLKVNVTLIMPHDAPTAKVQNAQSYGAEVILCHSTEPSREEAASLLAQKMAIQYEKVLLHPFDDRQIIIGQSSVSIELFRQLAAMKKHCQHLLCPTGGGSLVAGASLVAPEASNIWAIEADGFQGMGLSLQHKTRTRAKGAGNCECDALMALEPGKENFNITLQTGVKGFSVTHPYIREAVRLLFSELKLVVEPSGTAGVAALLEAPRLFKRSTVVAIASGGNVDSEKYSDILSVNWGK
ncbi:threonine ammonia-lyase [Endozoicomonas ascidiicola]|uniref:threonine ammonia-lyase n=1 Tax=Endozoicomonas ascidiicola TaxID=1698521 RepID=UPI00082D0851|nr:pyridoxal-phosphate dependent enzyme [Endozoicomonas ascidiicola]